MGKDEGKNNICHLSVCCVRERSLHLLHMGSSMIHVFNGQISKGKISKASTKYQKS